GTGAAIESAAGGQRGGRQCEEQRLDQGERAGRGAARRVGTLDTKTQRPVILGAWLHCRCHDKCLPVSGRRVQADTRCYGRRNSALPPRCTKYANTFGQSQCPASPTLPTAVLVALSYPSTAKEPAVLVCAAAPPAQGEANWEATPRPAQMGPCSQDG